MNDRDIPDFTSAYKKIFTLTRDLLALRRAFPHSASDSRAERDRRFIEAWREIARKNGEVTGEAARGERGECSGHHPSGSEERISRIIGKNGAGG